MFRELNKREDKQQGGERERERRYAIKKQGGEFQGGWKNLNSGTLMKSNFSLIICWNWKFQTSELAVQELVKLTKELKEEKYLQWRMIGNTKKLGEGLKLNL